jgi:predicted dehydrogenase
VSDQLHVGVAGLYFGSAFLPIYQRHPAVREVSIADTDPDRLAWAGDTFGVRRRHASLDGLLADPDVDAIHLLTPVSYHARQSVAVLRAGKHCAPCRWRHRSMTCWPSSPPRKTPGART